jgi:hypothetical protein
MNPQPTRWFLRSMGDRDTHRGEQRTDGTVVAACDVVFEPRSLRIALPGAGDPPDPDQICPQCYRAKTTR